MRTLTAGLILILAVPGMAAAGDTPNLSPPVDRPLSVNKKSSVESSSATLDAQNLIVNGDFENNVGGCLSNLSNAQFNASISNATAFGAANEIDIYNDPGGCRYGLPPQSGTTKLAIHRQREVGGATDAFSLDLSPSVVAGNNYHLSLYANVVLEFDPNVGPVEVGLSSSPTDFGTLIFSGTPSTSEWTLLDGDFTAPTDAAYLTVRVGTDGTWIHIDNFRLEAACNFSSAPGEPERCFGGIGVRCEGIPIFAPFTQDEHTCLVSGWMSVGSILHDRCCLATNNAGYSCSGSNQGDKRLCKKEWDEAYYNTQCTALGATRQWTRTFGPYPAGNTGDDTSQHLRAPIGANVNQKYEYLCASGRCQTNAKGKTIVKVDLCGKYCECQ